jgi:hypothetical protein
MESRTETDRSPNTPCPCLHAQGCGHYGVQVGKNTKRLPVFSAIRTRKTTTCAVYQLTSRSGDAVIL